VNERQINQAEEGGPYAGGKPYKERIGAGREMVVNGKRDEKNASSQKAC